MRFARKAGSSYQLLIIDQFEDIFSRLPHDEAGRNNFFQVLGEILQRNKNIKVLLSMRDEYLGELDRFRHFIPGRLKATFRLELLSKQQAFDAITLTAKRAKHPIRLCAEDVRGMVDDLSQLGASDLGGKKAHKWESHFVEPLFLQLACKDAWPGILKRSKKLEASAEGRETPCVSLEDSTSTKELDAVLSRFYENTVETQQSNTTNGDELKLRLFVQDGLITPSGIRNLIGVEEVELRWGLTEQDIEPLITAHLVRPQRRNRETFYELAHDRILSPIKSNNEDWIKKNLLDWRKAARLAERGGDNQNLSFIKVFQAYLESKKNPASLIPYEKIFIENSKKYKWKLLRQFLVFLTVWGFIVGGYSFFVGDKAKEVRIAQQKNEIAQQKNKISLQATNISQTHEYLNFLGGQLDEAQDKFDKQEKKLSIQSEEIGKHIQNQLNSDETIKKQKNLSIVRGLMGRYPQRKWMERNDESAILQVREAYSEAKRRFESDKIPEELTISFLTAFNNAMTPIEGAPGFARTISLGLEQNQPIAIHSGDNPKVAYFDTELNCLAIRNLDKNPGHVNCVHNHSLPPTALDFDPKGRYLAASYSEGIFIFTLKGLPGNDLVKPKLFEAGQPVDLFSFSADGARLVYLSKNSVKVLCNKSKWVSCAKGAISPVSLKFTKIAISLEVNGKRRISVARKNGDIVLMDLDDKQAGDKAVSIIQHPLIKKPEKKYNFAKDDRSVLYLGFVGKSQMLLVVHSDTQIFLWKMNGDDKQLVKQKIIRKTGLANRSTKSEEGNKHFQAAALSSEAKLFTVLDDEITEWDLSKIEFEKKHATVSSVSRKTGSRNLKQLSVSKEWLIGRGFFKLWLWEQDRSLESKLIHSRFPEPKMKFEKGLLFYPQAISFGLDNKLIVGTSQQGLMRWAPDSNNAWITNDLSVCEGFEDISVRSIALSPDRSLIALAMGRRNNKGPGHLMVLPLSGLKKWDFCNKSFHKDGLWAVAFSSDGRWLVSGDYLGKAHIWKIDNNRLEHHAELKLKNNNIIRSMAFHPKHNLLAIGKRVSEKNNTLGVVELVLFDNEGQKIDSDILEFSKGGIGSILDIDFSNDGDSLVAVGENGPIRLWKINADKKIKVESSRLLSGHAGGTTALAFNPELGYLATGGKDGLVRVWDLEDRTSESANLAGIDADVMSLSWRKDGKQLAVSYKHSSYTSEDLSNKHSHGVVTLWHWDLSRISEIVCNTTWRTLDKNEWNNWIKPVSGHSYEPACEPNGLPLDEEEE